jgi:hypothetical protein
MRNREGMMKSYAVMVTIVILGLLSALVVVSSNSNEAAESALTGETVTIDQQDLQDIEDMIKRLEIRIVALESDIFGSTGLTGHPFRENSVEGWISDLDARLSQLEAQ